MKPWTSGLAFLIIAGAGGVVALASEPSADVAAPAAPPPPGEVVTELRVVDPQADAWLRRIEAAGEGVKALHAEVRYDRNNGLTGSKQRRFGHLSYQAGPPSRFAVYFDRLLTGRRSEKEEKWYIYDGRWIVERIEGEKVFIKHRVVRPEGESGEGEARDPLALGEGPFPVPVGQKREEILRRFEVSVLDASADDPENTVRLRLTPRAGHRIDFTSIDLWYDRDTLLPRRVLALDDVSQDEVIVELLDPKVNDEVDESVFDTRAPSERGERGWREEINP